MTVLALAGGVGGARLAAGLSRALPAGSLTIAVNTGDDFEHLGLSISPDIDTVVYTLAGLGNPEQGWGLAGESWSFMAALERLGGKTWFRLGDRDLATHVERTRRLAQGETLSAITADFAARLGINQLIVPMSDDRVRTIVGTDGGDLAFQDYFVRRQCNPVLQSIRFDGAETATLSGGFLRALADPALKAIIICPSNPVLSLGPILALPTIRDRLRTRAVPVVAVSPFIGGQAVKGPAAKIMAELGLPTTPDGLLSLYAGLVDGLVIDHADARNKSASDVRLCVTGTLMRNADDQLRLAEEVIAFARLIATR